MFKNLQIKSWILLLAVLLGGGSAWAETKSVDITPSQALNEGGVAPITIVCAKGDGTANPAISSGQLRLYQAGSGKTTGNTITFSSEKTITSIVFTFANSMTADNGVFSEGSYDSSTNTWSGSTNSVTLTVTGTKSGERIYITALTVYYEDGNGGGGDTPTQTVANPQFNPAAGTYTSTQNVEISTTTEGAIIYYTLDGSDPTTSSNSYSSAIEVSSTTTIKAIAVKENMNNSAIATASYIINTPYSGSGYVRVNDISSLTDGVKVIIAARYDSDLANAYYAMTATTSGKPTGVSFTSTIGSNGEEVILDDIDDYTWTLGVNNDEYTFTNASGDVLGYSSGTNFATGGSNTGWGIEIGTAGGSAMVDGYEGFRITNTTKTDRGIALNSSYNYGPYSTSNINNSGYNFYLDIFVEGAASSVTPSISANNVNIAYDATSGSISYTLNNEPSPAGILTAATATDSWLTLGTVTSSAVPFTCSANDASTERTATVTLTYSYGDNETVTKDVTITQAAAPVIYSTIPALFAAAESNAKTVEVTFDSWVVSGVSTNGKNVFVTDNNGNGFVIYSSSDMSETYAVGDILSGTAVSCSLKLNQGYAQIIDLDASALTITAGGNVSTANIALVDLAGVNTGSLVSYNNLTCSVSSGKYYLSDGTTTIQLYNSLYAFAALEDGETYNITGIYQQYNTTKEILPRSVDDIVKVVSTKPSITVDPATVNENAGEHNGTLALTYANLTISDMTDFEIQYCDAKGEVTDEPGWVEVTVAKQDPQIGEGYVVSYYMIENDGEARTAYFKVWAMDDETNLIPSNLVTVTQAKYVEATSYTLATTITSGKHYIIVGQKNEIYKAVGQQNANNRAAVEVTNNEGTISVASDAGVCEFVISGPSASGNYTIFDESTDGGYLYAAQGTGTGNYMRTESVLDTDGNGIWSISINNEGAATIISSNESIDRNTMRYNSGSSCFSCYASGQQDIYLYEKDGEATPTETVTVTDAKYATYCSKNALDFEGTGVTAYTATMVGNTVKFNPVNKVPAYEGVLLKAETAGDFTIGTATSVDTDENWSNAFIGVTEQKTINETIFVLMKGDWEGGKGVGFYQTKNAFTVGANTAYLPALAGGTGDSARSFIGFDFGGETTAVEGVAAQTMSNGEVYNLQGQRVVKAQKGLYIMNGKKVLVK